MYISCDVRGWLPTGGGRLTSSVDAHRKRSKLGSLFPILYKLAMLRRRQPDARLDRKIDRSFVAWRKLRHSRRRLSSPDDRRSGSTASRGSPMGRRAKPESQKYDRELADLPERSSSRRQNRQGAAARRAAQCAGTHVRGRSGSQRSRSRTGNRDINALHGAFNG